MLSEMLADLQDSELARRAKCGDREALEALLERHAPLAARVAYAVLAQQADALDAAQNALIQVAQHISDWSSSSFPGWVSTIAHRAAVDVLRQNRSRQRREHQQAMESATNPRATEVQADPAESQELRAAIHEELTEVSEQTSSVLLLYHFEGYSVQDVADATGLSLSACKQRLSRGREELRERLERRGLGLASLALVPAALDSLRGVTQGFGADADPALFAQMARSATAVAHCVSPNENAASSTSSTPSTHPASPMALAPAKDRRIATPGTEVPTMQLNSKSVTRVLLAGTAALVLCGAVIYRLSNPAGERNLENAGPYTSSVPPSPTARREAPSGPGHASRASAVAAPAVVLPPQWQFPRAITADGALLPLSLAGQGRHAAILASEYGHDGKENALQLIESDDSGQSWSVTQRFDGYSDGDVAFDLECRCMILAMKPSAAGSFVQPSALMNSDRFSRIDWLMRPNGGVFGAPEPVWSSESNDDAFVYKPKLIPVHGRVWAFALRLKKTPQKAEAQAAWIQTRGVVSEYTARVVVAAGGPGCCPQPLALPLEASGTAIEVPSVWSADAKTAGFLVESDKPGELKQFTTHDGGTTWSATSVPILLPQSAVTVSDALPVQLTRSGNNLALLVNVRTLNPHAFIDFQSGKYRGYMLHSSDLGRSWSGASPVTADIGLTGLIQIGVNAKYGLHAMGERIFFLHTRIAFELGMRDIVKAAMMQATAEKGKEGAAAAFSPEKAPTVSLPVLMSDDGARTWSDYHALDSIIDATKPCIAVIGGDEQATHIAVLRKSGLVVRTFTSGQWKAPDARPAWFQEEKLPPATRQDF